MADDGGVEQGGGLDGVLHGEVAADEQAPLSREVPLPADQVRHHLEVRFEDLRDVLVSTLEVAQHLAQVVRHRFVTELTHTVNDGV